MTLTPDSWTLEPLAIGHLAEVLDFWRRTQPLHPLNESLLRERLFTNPGADPELLLAARTTLGGLVGLAAGAYVPEHLRYAGIRWLAIEPGLEGRGIETLLLDELCRRLAARGAVQARLLATPPYYLRPGVDTRQTELIAALLRLGWAREATFFNMTVDLARWPPPPDDAIFAPNVQGYAVRRAHPTDRQAFTAYMNEAWTPNWRDEARQAFDHDPISLFLALQGERIVGFAAYEVGQCLGGFGPTGISPEHRGAGLGRRTLWACLADLKHAGRPLCEIGWTDQVEFYYRSAGARLGSAYWHLVRSLEGFQDEPPVEQ